MWQILQIILQGFHYSRTMGWWVGAPIIVIGVILGLQLCSAQMDAKRRTLAIYDALPETIPGWTPKAEKSSDEAEGSSQFSRVLEKDGKRLRIMLKTGFVLSRKSEEEFLREVADKPDRVRFVERVAGNTVYLDRVIPTLCVALMFLGDRGLITVSLFVPRGQTADCADALAYLHTLDQGALKQALRD